MHVIVHIEIYYCLRFDDVTMSTLKHYLFLKLAKWESIYENDIFWGPWPKCPTGYAHGDNVRFYFSFPGFMLEFFNSNVTKKFVQPHDCLSQSIGGQNILCPPLFKSVGHVFLSTLKLAPGLCNIRYVSHASSPSSQHSGRYPWVARIRFLGLIKRAYHGWRSMTSSGAPHFDLTSGPSNPKSTSGSLRRNNPSFWRDNTIWNQSRGLREVRS